MSAAREPYCSACNDEHSQTSLDLSKLADLLNDLRDYFEPRADADMVGDPPMMRPNPEMRLLHKVRVACHSVELMRVLAPQPSALELELRATVDSIFAEPDPHEPDCRCRDCDEAESIAADVAAENAADDGRFARERDGSAE